MRDRDLVVPSNFSRSPPPLPKLYFENEKDVMYVASTPQKWEREWQNDEKRACAGGLEKNAQTCGGIEKSKGVARKDLDLERMRERDMQRQIQNTALCNLGRHDLSANASESLRRVYVQKETQRSTHRDADAAGKNGAFHEDGKRPIIFGCAADVSGKSDCVSGSASMALSSDSIPTRLSISRVHLGRWGKTMGWVREEEFDAWEGKEGRAWEWEAKNEIDGINSSKVERDREREIAELEHELKLNQRDWEGKWEARAKMNVSKTAVKPQEDSQGERLASDFDASHGAMTPRKNWGGRKESEGSLLGGTQDWGGWGELDSDGLACSLSVNQPHVSTAYSLAVTPPCVHPSRQGKISSGKWEASETGEGSKKLEGRENVSRSGEELREVRAKADNALQKDLTHRALNCMHGSSHTKSSEVDLFSRTSFRDIFASVQNFRETFQNFLPTPRAGPLKMSGGLSMDQVSQDMLEKSVGEFLENCLQYTTGDDDAAKIEQIRCLVSVLQKGNTLPSPNETRVRIDELRTGDLEILYGIERTQGHGVGGLGKGGGVEAALEILVDKLNARSQANIRTQPSQSRTRENVLPAERTVREKSTVGLSAMLERSQCLHESNTTDDPRGYRAEHLWTPALTKSRIALAQTLGASSPKTKSAKTNAIFATAAATPTEVPVWMSPCNAAIATSADMHMLWQAAQSDARGGGAGGKSTWQQGRAGAESTSVACLIQTSKTGSGGRVAFEKGIGLLRTSSAGNSAVALSGTVMAGCTGVVGGRGGLEGEWGAGGQGEKDSQKKSRKIVDPLAKKFVDAVKAGDVTCVRQLLGRDQSLCNATADLTMGFTPLHWASAKNHADICRILLESQANINACNRQGVTALHSASLNGCHAVVQLLLAQGADMYATDVNGRSAEACAKSKGNECVVLFELSKKVQELSLSSTAWTKRNMLEALRLCSQTPPITCTCYHELEERVRAALPALANVWQDKLLYRKRFLGKNLKVWFHKMKNNKWLARTFEHLKKLRLSRALARSFRHWRVLEREYCAWQRGFEASAAIQDTNMRRIMQKHCLQHQFSKWSQSCMQRKHLVVVSEMSELHQLKAALACFKLLVQSERVRTFQHQLCADHAHTLRLRSGLTAWKSICASQKERGGGRANLPTSPIMTFIPEIKTPKLDMPTSPLQTPNLVGRGVAETRKPEDDQSDIKIYMPNLPSCLGGGASEAPTSEGNPSTEGKLVARVGDSRRPGRVESEALKSEPEQPGSKHTHSHTHSHVHTGGMPGMPGMSGMNMPEMPGMPTWLAGPPKTPKSDVAGATSLSRHCDAAARAKEKASKLLRGEEALEVRKSAPAHLEQVQVSTKTEEEFQEMAQSQRELSANSATKTPELKGPSSSGKIQGTGFEVLFDRDYINNLKMRWVCKQRAFVYLRRVMRSWLAYVLCRWRARHRILRTRLLHWGSFVALKRKYEARVVRINVRREVRIRGETFRIWERRTRAILRQAQLKGVQERAIKCVVGSKTRRLMVEAFGSLSREFLIRRQVHQSRNFLTDGRDEQSFNTDCLQKIAKMETYEKHVQQELSALRREVEESRLAREHTEQELLDTQEALTKALSNARKLEDNRQDFDDRMHKHLETYRIEVRSQKIMLESQKHVLESRCLAAEEALKALRGSIPILEEGCWGRQGESPRKSTRRNISSIHRIHLQETHLLDIPKSLETSTNDTQALDHLALFQKTSSQLSQGLPTPLVSQLKLERASLS